MEEVDATDEEEDDVDDELLSLFTLAVLMSLLLLSSSADDVASRSLRSFSISISMLPDVFNLIRLREIIFFAYSFNF